MTTAKTHNPKKPFAIHILAPALLLLLALAARNAPAAAGKVFNILDFGAVGDGVTLDTAAIQRAIDAAAQAGGGAQVFTPPGRSFLVSTLQLRGGMDFHLDGQLIISTNRADYQGEGVLTALNADHLQISGAGAIRGQSLAFMTRYDPAGEWWLFASWRPKMFILTGCSNLQIRDITFSDAPYWGLHMLGCKNVFVDHLTVSNRMDVPNCDGIDPDHCQDVEIRNCRITSGDDCVVIKTSRQAADYGPSANITVRDCVLETQDSGVKIGTETTSDIHDILFERCRILTSSRGLTIQLRDEGSVYRVQFKDIHFTSRYYADPWWGRGEAVSLTALPRTPGTKLGALHDITLQNITGLAENSVRIQGTPANPVHDVLLDTVDITLSRWTKYPGRLFDNRPTMALEQIQTHDTPGFSILDAANITLKNCAVHWDSSAPEHQIPSYFSVALEAENTRSLRLTNFKGEAAHPDRDQAVVIH
ncbi:MAG: glycosyl hydrolase family 28 protein [Verrucomicrobiota bacterium]|jgi:polygalacturonase